ncbi:patatin-like phospholipase family protein [Rugamonas sp. A1-17]|nr:patatin-like phospholipase family protein [Rugamonas sp. A1-17]
MVLAGGGFRFGYYLGMHAAAVDAGQEPDLLLATCGGAVAGAIIRNLPDSAARKAWLASPQMYEFFRGLRSGPRATPLRALAGIALRRMNGARAARIPDLFNDYLFEIPPVLPLPPERAPARGAMSAAPTTPSSALAPVPVSGIVPALAIVGGRLLFGPDEAGQLRQGRAIYRVTLFGDERTAALASGQASAIGRDGWTDAVAHDLAIDTTMPLADVARISIADMVYFRCQSAGGADYTGGAIDLFPIELARCLARHVSMEMKQAYDQQTAIPALRAVFGIDANARLRHVHGQPADVWIDTSDVSQALRGTGIQKRIAWRANRVQLVAPATYERYVADVETQWQYGYQRAQEAYALAAQGRSPAMRNATRHNKATA